MDSTSFYDLKNNTLMSRYEKTVNFVKSSLPAGQSILDIGVENPLSKLLSKEGYKIINTKDVDLDEDAQVVSEVITDASTAFEIFEHLVNPLGVLKAIQSKRLFTSVPLALWFAKAYKHKTNSWDRHFHEFEDWQFDWLLEKAGWEIVRREKWVSPTQITGIRPMLRLITPRYYAVEAVKLTR
jgi:hypothetical protein